MKNYLYLVFTSLFSFIATITFGQECKTETDPFTNEKVISYDFMRETIVYEHKGGNSFIKIKLNLDGEINMAFNEGTTVLLKTEKGKILNLVTIEKSIPVSQVSGTRVISSVVFISKLTDQMLSDLKESKVVLIRHPDGKGTQYDLPINKKVGKGFQEGADCLIKSI